MCPLVSTFLIPNSPWALLPVPRHGPDTTQTGEAEARYFPQPLGKRSTLIHRGKICPEHGQALCVGDDLRTMIPDIYTRGPVGPAALKMADMTTNQEPDWNDFILQNHSIVLTTGSRHRSHKVYLVLQAQTNRTKDPPT